MRTLNRVFTHAPKVATNARTIILEQMQDGDWYTLRELAFIAGCSEAAASARIRDLRKKKFGGYKVATQAGYGGQPWLYRLAV